MANISHPGPRPMQFAPNPVEKQPQASLSSQVEGAFHSAGDALEGAFDKGAGLDRTVLSGAAQSLGSGVSDSASVVGQAISEWGAPESGTAVSSVGQVAGSVINQGSEVLLEQRERFGQGMGDGAADLVKDLGTAIANPVQTANGMRRLMTAAMPMTVPVRAILEGKNPLRVAAEDQQLLTDVGKSFVSEFTETYQDHGAAGVAGRVGFDLLSTVLTRGGATAAKAPLKMAGKGLEVAGKLADAGQAGGAIVDTRQ